MNNFILKLGALTNGINSFTFDIKDQFFEAFTLSDVKHADIIATALLDKDSDKIGLNLRVDGKINNQLCDICTEELSIDITADTDVVLKITDEDLHSTDEIFYIKKSENSLNLKQLIFEIIILNLPNKRQHPFDENGNSICNEEMVDLVNKYKEVEKKSSDARWDALKDIKIK
jgi:uncharacterized metal-binding protein YceD (DUF177 family)